DLHSFPTRRSSDLCDEISAKPIHAMRPAFSMITCRRKSRVSFLAKIRRSRVFDAGSFDQRPPDPWIYSTPAGTARALALPDDLLFGTLLFSGWRRWRLELE